MTALTSARRAVAVPSDDKDRIRAAEALVYRHYGVDPVEGSRRVDTGCGRTDVRFTEFSPHAPGVPVVVFHGVGSATVLAAALLGQLGHRRVIAVDWPGHGLSGPCVLPAQLGLRTHAVTTLASLLDTLGIRQVDLVGHSLGAQFSLYVAHDLPARVRRVVLLGAPGAALEGVKPAAAMKLLAVPGLGRALLSLPMSQRTFTNTQDVFLGRGAFDDSPAELAATLLLIGNRRANAASIASFFRALIKRGSVRDGVALTHEELERIQKPLLFVWGDQDVFLAPRDAASAIVSVRDVRLLRLPTAGHAPWLRSLDLVGPAVVDHLGAGISD